MHERGRPQVEAGVQDVVEAAVVGETPVVGGTASLDLRSDGRIPTVSEQQEVLRGTTASQEAGLLDDKLRKHIDYCIERINWYRENHRPTQPPRQRVQEHPPLSQFAQIGAQEHAAGGPDHGHFDASFANDGKGPPRPTGMTRKRENQGAWPTTDINKAIDNILKDMIAEGPTPPGKQDNHHDNMLDPEARFVGVGIVVSGTHVWVTMDFVGTSGARRL